MRTKNYKVPKITRRIFLKSTILLNLVFFFPVHFESKKNPVLSCAMCDEEDLSENLQATGSHPTKTKVVKAKHNKNFTKNTNKWP